MRLKRPNADLSFPSLSAESKELCKKSFKVKLITPLYGGGTVTGQPDEEMPVRASAIRGQLRFWWRILNPGKTLKDEMEIWGGMSNSGAVASRVFIAVREVKNVAAILCAKEYEKKENGEWNTLPEFHYGQESGYVLFPGQGKCNKRNGVQEQPHNILELGLTFELKVKVRDEKLWEQVIPALRWWASFGGLGARTRRGLGSIEIKDIEPVTDVSAVNDCKLVFLSREADAAVSAWKTAIKKLSDFRQGLGTGRNGSNSKYGRSRWPEADSIRQITGTHAPNHCPEHKAAKSFPRAVFGLPIITQFKDEKQGDPANTQLYPALLKKKPGENNEKPEKKDRMASPLILKAMWTKNGYKPIALLLPYKHTKDMCLQLEGEAKNLPHKMSPTEWWSKEAQEAMRKNSENSESPLKDRSGDVLQDFLDFFEGK